MAAQWLRSVVAQWGLRAVASWQITDPQWRPHDNCIIRLSTVMTQMLSLCVESSLLNFLPCMLRILYLFRQNALASMGFVPRPQTGALPLDPPILQTPCPLAITSGNPLARNSGSPEPSLVKVSIKRLQV